ncbi:cell division protein SepF [Alteribacillus sp. HJP-4]|uniref:cell division protein SepF n=1 Tax=Alteribacillus sp. HJP-4 TaxID=2775394 RepID=UPI0035CCC971
MTIKSKFKRFFELDDDVVEQEMEVRDDTFYQEDSKPSSGKNVVSLQSVQQSSKVILLEPRNYEEAQDIADHLKNRKAVIINLQRIQKEQAKRIVDFLSGTVYAIGGDIQKVGVDIFLCTPDNIDVSGTISEILYNSYD